VSRRAPHGGRGGARRAASSETARPAVTSMGGGGGPSVGQMPSPWHRADRRHRRVATWGGEATALTVSGRLGEGQGQGSREPTESWTSDSKRGSDVVDRAMKPTSSEAASSTPAAAAIMAHESTQSERWKVPPIVSPRCPFRAEEVSIAVF